MMLSATNEALMATSPISKICQFSLSKMFVEIVCMRMSVHTFVSVYYAMFGKKYRGNRTFLKTYKHGNWKRKTLLTLAC